MNKNIMRAVGFEEEVKAVEGGQCPFCKKSTSIDDFRDDLSRREFRISGLCQGCQNEMFGAD